MDIFSQIINIIGSCPSCESKNISFILNPVNRKGLSSCLEDNCQNCLEENKEIYTGKELKNNSKRKITICHKYSIGVTYEGNRSRIFDIRKIVWIFKSFSPMQVNTFNETKSCFRGVQYCSITINDRSS